MPQQIDVPGMGIVEFPDGMPDAEISAAIKRTLDAQPSVAGDVAKSAGTGLASGVIGLAGMPGDLADLATRGVDYLAGTKSNEAFGKTIGDYAGSGALQGYLEKLTGKFYEPKTTAGKYAHTIAEFAPAAIGGPETLAARLVKRAVIPGIASEAAGQATEGTGLEPAARVGAALAAGGLASIKKEAGPSTAEVKQAAQNQYSGLTSRNVAIPIQQSELDNLASDIRTTLNAKGVRPSTADKIHNAITEIQTPATQGAADVADLVAARQNVKSLLGSPDANKAGAAIALPKIESAIERLSPGTMQEIRSADKNWTAVKANEALDKRMARADLRASGEHSGLNVGNRIRQNVASYLLSNESRYLSAADRATLEKVVHGTITQNALRLVSNLLGGGGGLGSTLLGIGGAAAGASTGNPEAALLPVAGIGLRMGANRLTARQASNAAATIRNRSPYGQKLAQSLPQPVAPLLGPALIRALIANQASVPLRLQSSTAINYPR